MPGAAARSLPGATPPAPGPARCPSPAGRDLRLGAPRTEILDGAGRGAARPRLQERSGRPAVRARCWTAAAPAPARRDVRDAGAAGAERYGARASLRCSEKEIALLVSAKRSTPIINRLILTDYLNLGIFLGRCPLGK